MLQTALLPPTMAVCASLLAGPLADHMISSGAPLGFVRKLMQVRGHGGLPVCVCVV